MRRQMIATYFKTAADFRKWLKTNHAKASELLLGFYKADSGIDGISYKDAVDEALCFGWIDAVRRRVDEQRYTIRFTPRKKSSIWSQVNVKNIERLVSEKRMTPAGMAAYEARSEKRMKVYSFEREVEKLSPEQVRQFGPAWTFFEQQPAWYRKVTTHWVTSAKKEETREKRLAQLIECSAAGE